MIKSMSAIAAVLLATALVAPTVTQAEEVPSARVSYADLNLANADARETLQNRVQFAATSICDNGARSMELEQAQSARLCRTNAIASAQPALDAAFAAARRGTVTVLTGASLTVTAQ